MVVDDGPIFVFIARTFYQTVSNRPTLQYGVRLNSIQSCIVHVSNKRLELYLMNSVVINIEINLIIFNAFFFFFSKIFFVVLFVERIYFFTFYPLISINFFLIFKKFENIESFVIASKSTSVDASPLCRLIFFVFFKRFYKKHLKQVSYRITECVKTYKCTFENQYMYFPCK